MLTAYEEFTYYYLADLVILPFSLNIDQFKHVTSPIIIMLMSKVRSLLHADDLPDQNPPSNYNFANDGDGFWLTLGTSKVLDARRRGATTEAYEQYAAGRSDRRQRSR